jgi:hypothetical protein
MSNFKVLIFILLSLFIGGNLSAAELTSEQKRFRSSLQEFLKEEGFMPTIDNEDNSLNFKKEGILYWISVGGTTPLYIEFHRSGLKCEDANKSLVLQAANMANRKVRCAKAMFNETSISFAIEMYCHSVEEFKYTFYKCMAELDRIRDEVYEYYNASDSSTATNRTVKDNSSSILDKIFPIYGITLGKTTISQVQSMGYTIDINSGHKNSDVKDLTFWDFNNDNIFDYVSISKYDAVPESIKNLGLNWNMTYDQILAKFRSLGFNVSITKTPSTQEYSGRKTLYAEFRALSPDNKLKVEVKFRYGNAYGDGYSTNSPNTFYEMTFDVDF